MITPDPAQGVIPRIAPIPTYMPAWQPHLLSGPSGVGKTCFCAWWATRLRDGDPIFGKPTNPLPWIGMITTDREQEDTLLWYEIAGWPTIPRYSAVDAYDEFNYFRIKNPEIALSKLTTIIDHMQVPPNGLLILDPISMWAGGDLNKYDRVMPAMGALSQLCLRRKLTILGIAHTGKQRADPTANYARAQDKILGSMALLGSSGTQMALEGPTQTGFDGQWRFSWTPHHAPAEEYLLERDQHTGLFIPVAADTAALDLPAAEHDQLLALIELLPIVDPLATGDWLGRACFAYELSRPTFFRRAKRAADLGLVEKLAHGQYRRRPVQ